MIIPEKMSCPPGMSTFFTISHLENLSVPYPIWFWGTYSSIPYTHNMTSYIHNMNHCTAQKITLCLLYIPFPPPSSPASLRKWPDQVEYLVFSLSLAFPVYLLAYSVLVNMNVEF